MYKKLNIYKNMIKVKKNMGELMYKIKFKIKN